jgi:hypothetical protein
VLAELHRVRGIHARPSVTAPKVPSGSPRCPSNCMGTFDLRGLLRHGPDHVITGYVSNRAARAFFCISRGCKGLWASPSFPLRFHRTSGSLVLAG